MCEVFGVVISQVHPVPWTAQSLDHSRWAEDARLGRQLHGEIQTTQAEPERLAAPGVGEHETLELKVLQNDGFIMKPQGVLEVER